MAEVSNKEIAQMKKVLEENEEKEAVYSGECAYISLDVQDEYGRVDADWHLDDKCGGWMWSGGTDDGQFILGLLRVEHSAVSKKFNEEVEEEGIDKDGLYIAVNESLENDSKDGLYNILGDNSFFMQGIEGMEEGAVKWIEEDLSDRLDEEGIELPEEIVSEIVDKATFDAGVNDDEMIDYFAGKMGEYYGENLPKKWDELVKHFADECYMQSENGKEFLICMGDKLDSYDKDGLIGDEDSYVEEEFYDTYIENLCKVLTDEKELEEIAEWHDYSLSKLKEVGRKLCGG